MSFLKHFFFYLLMIVLYIIDTGTFFYAQAPATAGTIALLIPACLHDTYCFFHLMPLACIIVGWSFIVSGNPIPTTVYVLSILLLGHSIHRCINTTFLFTLVVSLVGGMVYMGVVQKILLYHSLFSCCVLGLVNGIIALLTSFFYTKE